MMHWRMPPLMLLSLALSLPAFSFAADGGETGGGSSNPAACTSKPANEADAKKEDAENGGTACVEWWKLKGKDGALTEAEKAEQQKMIDDIKAQKDLDEKGVWGPDPETNANAQLPENATPASKEPSGISENQVREMVTARANDMTLSEESRANAQAALQNPEEITRLTNAYNAPAASDNTAGDIDKLAAAQRNPESYQSTFVDNGTNTEIANVNGNTGAGTATSKNDALFGPATATQKMSVNEASLLNAGSNIPAGTKVAFQSITPNAIQGDGAMFGSASTNTTLSAQETSALGGGLSISSYNSTMGGVATTGSFASADNITTVSLQEAGISTQAVDVNKAHTVLAQQQAQVGSIQHSTLAQQLNDSNMLRGFQTVGADYLANGTGSVTGSFASPEGATTVSLKDSGIISLVVDPVKGQELLAASQAKAATAMDNKVAIVATPPATPPAPTLPPVRQPPVAPPNPLAGIAKGAQDMLTGVAANPMAMSMLGSVLSGLSQGGGGGGAGGYGAYGNAGYSNANTPVTTMDSKGCYYTASGAYMNASGQSCATQQSTTTHTAVTKPNSKGCYFVASGSFVCPVTNAASITTDCFTSESSVMVCPADFGSSYTDTDEASDNFKKGYVDGQQGKLIDVTYSNDTVYMQAYYNGQQDKKALTGTQ